MQGQVGDLTLLAISAERLRSPEIRVDPEPTSEAGDDGGAVVQVREADDLAGRVHIPIRNRDEAARDTSSRVGDR
ncbi:MAG TPA: hypothetical protein PK593_10615, partial [Thermomicrobiales bacterium]|nr:hypothetical protein [Thermomicrobiales bacterium]